MRCLLKCYLLNTFTLLPSVLVSPFQVLAFPSQPLTALPAPSEGLRSPVKAGAGCPPSLLSWAEEGHGQAAQHLREDVSEAPV